MATGGGPFEEGMNDQDLPSWSNESLDDRLNNTVWFILSLSCYFMLCVKITR